jgi:hypothetical protein
MKKDKDLQLIWENYLSETSAQSVKDKADLDDDGKVSEYEKKRSDTIMKNDDDESNDKHICATKVEHHKFGHGQCVFSEHAQPSADGHVSWYTVQFEHGTEVINTADLTVHEESSHGNH